jgi:CRP-like cAMP-binding protein
MLVNIRSVTGFLCFYEVGAPFEYVYFVTEGVASVITKITNGEGIEAGITGSQGMVGLPALLGREESSQHVIAQAPVTALRMDVADFKTAFEESVAIRRVLLRYTGTLLNTACQTAACKRLHSLQQRCARWLMMMHDRHQSDAMPLTMNFSR